MSKPDFVGEAIYAPFLREMVMDPGVQRREVLTRMYARVLSEMCMNRYHWTGLPEEIDPRFLEMTLFSQGLAVFSGTMSSVGISHSGVLVLVCRICTTIRLNSLCTETPW